MEKLLTKNKSFTDGFFLSVLLITELEALGDKSWTKAADLPHPLG